VAKFSGVSIASGASFQELAKRPNMMPEDAAAIERGAPSIEVVSIILGQGAANETLSRGNQRTMPMPIVGVDDKYTRMTRLPIEIGRFFNAVEVQRRANVVVLGQGPYKALFAGVDPIGKLIRVGLAQYEVIGVLGKRPTPGGFDLGADNFAAIPQSTYQKQFGLRAVNFGRGEMRPVMIGACLAKGVPRSRRCARSRTSCASVTGCASTSRTTSTSSRRTRFWRSGIRSARRRFWRSSCCRRSPCSSAASA
jgi:putative ABC transport system permease protein